MGVSLWLGSQPAKPFCSLRYLYRGQADVVEGGEGAEALGHVSDADERVAGRGGSGCGHACLFSRSWANGTGTVTDSDSNTFACARVPSFRGDGAVMLNTTYSDRKSVV